jgi:4-aminobutyrate aminotransferase-like enzyme
MQFLKFFLLLNRLAMLFVTDTPRASPVKFGDVIQVTVNDNCIPHANDIVATRRTVKTSSGLASVFNISIAMRSREKGSGMVTPATVAAGDGATLVNLEGRELIGFAGGIGVMNAGHCQPPVAEAL